MNFLETLVVGAYVFTASAWVAIGRLHMLLTNHAKHRFEAIEKRVSALEQRDGE